MADVAPVFRDAGIDVFGAGSASAIVVDGASESIRERCIALRGKVIR